MTAAVDCSQLTTLDRASVEGLIPLIEEAMAVAAQGLGLKQRVEGKFSYDSSGIEFKLRLSLPGVQGATQEEKDVAEFNTLCLFSALDRDMLGKTFSDRGETFRITGANRKATRFPVLATRAKDEKPFKFSVNEVLNRLREAHEAA